TFTDTDSTAHSTSASPVPLFDIPVASQDGIALDCQDKAKRVMGTLVLQAVSDSGAGIGALTPVEVYVGGEYEV
ncbi:hypothetical protein KKF32_05165, partial [Patescibacteria group bacterium]|nr:hypothetical protein [Patescibacteria group bacterium]